MTNKELNSQIKTIHNAFKNLNKGNSLDPKGHQEQAIRKGCENIMSCVGAVSVMNQKNIIRMVRMQSHLKYMPEHRFFQAFIRAEEDLKL